MIPLKKKTQATKWSDRRKSALLKKNKNNNNNNNT